MNNLHIKQVFHPPYYENKINYFTLTVARYLGNPLIIESVIDDKFEDTVSNLESLLCSIGKHMLGVNIGDAYNVDRWIDGELTQPSVTLTLFRYGQVMFQLCVVADIYDRRFRIYSFRHPGCSTSNIEYIIACKIYYILQQKSSMCSEDLYDIYCLSELFNFDISKVRVYFYNISTNMNLYIKKFPLTKEQVYYLSKCYEVMKILKANIDYNLQLPEFKIVLDRFYLIMQHTVYCTDLLSWNYTSRYFV